MRRSATIIVIVLAALLFSHWLTETRMPVRLVEALAAYDLKAWHFLVFISLVMLLLGTVLEGLSIVLIIVPLVLPLLLELGIDPIHFAIIVVINIEIAMLTPPIGLNLFVLSGVSKAPLTQGGYPWLPDSGVQTWTPVGVQRPPGVSSIKGLILRRFARDAGGSGFRVASQKSGPVAGDVPRFARQHTFRPGKEP